ncbi:MAG: HD domain-containing protein [Rikenellaceae bacterium]|nr:HD domain-containing protein [Rikenellaceae bacterium]
MAGYDDFIELCRQRFSSADMVKVEQALAMAVESGGQERRYNGDPMAFHAVGCARIVAEELSFGVVSLVAALLHDAVRVGYMSLEQVDRAFGGQCRETLEGLVRISAVESKPDKEQIEHFKELIVNYSTNPRIILIKLADRLEVMRSLGHFPDHKRARKSWESLHIYSQLAHKLGLYKLKSELEDLSLRYMEPESYAHISDRLEQTASERDTFIAAFTAPIRRAMDAAGITYSIKGRTKSVYSIWRKMRKQHIPFEEVYDVFAIRIVIDCEPEKEKALCWHTYSMVTDFYKPNPDRMRDWISIPKSNGYESLHATVVTDDGKWVEVQIRTRRMDDIAERGGAAHWRYKGVEGNASGSEEWLSHLRQTLEALRNQEDIINFNEQPAPGNAEIFGFTPTGDLRKLPGGATLLDFAYDIHSGLGNTCVGGKVNHRNVSIREVLHNGDLVEVMTVKAQKPKADWLSFVVTSKARSRIKAYLREEEASRARLGREELERKTKNWKIALSLDEITNVLVKHYKLKTVIELYGMIADERIVSGDIKEVLVRYMAGENVTRHTEERGAPKVRTSDKGSDCLIISENLRDVEYKLGKCCSPIYGDDIFAFVTVHGGITVHRKDCRNGEVLCRRFPYRVLEAAWSDVRSGDSLFSAQVTLVCDDLMGLEHAVRQELKSLGIALRGMKMEYGDGMVTMQLTVEVRSVAMLDSVIHKLQPIKGVRRVSR